MFLSSIISDGMVLQRHAKVALWGNTERSQVVKVSFLGKLYMTASDRNGDWSIILENLEPGGPYQMEIVSDEEVRIIEDILIGDVWVLGGQSNMELPVSRTLDLFADEMKAVNSPFIRQFAVPQNYNFHSPQQELTNGKWTTAKGRDVMSFSAAGYFFAKELYEMYGVPVGLIQTAVGGTPIEAWISETRLRELGGFEESLRQCKDDAFVAATKRSDEERQTNWYKGLNEKDRGLVESWFNETYDATGWQEIELPSSWQDSELETVRGSVWFRKEIDLPASMSAVDAKLVLGTIIDADDTYINGTLIGNTGYMYPPRRYQIPQGLLKPGINKIVVRVISTHNIGGFIKDMPYKLIAGGQELDLQGTWNYHIGAITETLESSTFFQYKPAGVYNGMISPLRNYCMKGVLWYQGESNTHNPKGYSILFNALVKDWRSNWNCGDFPLIFTQLANLDTGETDPESSNWAFLREEQRMGLTNPNTAMAVTIDIGEHNDLHPQNKKTLGKRLALAAMKLAYDQEIVYSGPIYTRMERVGNAIHLYFDHVGSGLIAKNGELHSFTVCGLDGQFVPANAVIHGDSIIISHEKIMNPCHVRYAWLDNPDRTNLYNKEGLPASPFTTENGWEIK